VKLVHLAKRFFGSLPPGGPPAADEAWARSHLSPGEVALWGRMSGPDRRHAVGVARQVPESVVPAALLHDVGKVASGLGTYGRVVATLAGAVAGRDMAPTWSESRGFTRRVGLYLRHDALGADMLRLAGADPLTSTWAAEHHLPPERWTLPPDLANALKAADDD